MTAYALAISNGVAGQLANQDPHTVHSGLAEVAMPFGVGVVIGAADATLNLPSTAGATLAGVSLSSYANANASFAQGIQQYDAVSVLTNGVVYALSETAVTASGATPSPVYCRFATSGGNTQLGSFRTDPNGVAQVNTLTPTAVNSTTYTLDIDGRIYSFVSSGAATATTIVTQAKAAIAADAGATVTASGSTTLILTGNTVGKAFQVEADANWANVATTPPAPTAFLVPNAKWLTSCGAAGLAQLQLNLP